MHQATGRQLPETRHPFVDGVVVFDVVALEVFVALPPEVEPDDEQPDVVLRALGDDEAIACQAAGLVNQGRGGRPAGIVEHGVVQRRQDALECGLIAHVLQTPRVMRWHSSRTSRAEVRITPASATPTATMAMIAAFMLPPTQSAAERPSLWALLARLCPSPLAVRRYGMLW